MLQVHPDYMADW